MIIVSLWQFRFPATHQVLENGDVDQQHQHGVKAVLQRNGAQPDSQIFGVVVDQNGHGGEDAVHDGKRNKRYQVGEEKPAEEP